MRDGRIARWLADARSFPADARLAWHREGLRGVGSELRARTLRRLFSCGRFLVIESDLREDLDMLAPPPGVTVERFTGDWDGLAEILSARNRHRFCEGAARGRVCFVAWRGSRAIGYAWHVEKLDPEFDPAGITLPDDAAYGTDLYVTPAERNSGVGSALVSARLRYARERGFAKGWRMVAPSNRQSLRTVEKSAGPTARVICELRAVRVLGWRRARILPPPFVAPTGVAAQQAAGRARAASE